jgi:hypothetical protein
MLDLSLQGGLWTKQSDYQNECDTRLFADVKSCIASEMKKISAQAILWSVCLSICGGAYVLNGEVFVSTCSVSAWTWVLSRTKIIAGAQFP